MAQNKEQLNKLLDFISELVKEPGNESFVKGLQDIPELSISPKIDTSVLKTDEIYEYCIEKIIKEQAVLFYNNFPIHSIVDSLIEDFVRMEHFRRKGNFEDFSLAVYQQIEHVTNYIFKDSVFLNVVNRFKEESAYCKDSIATNRIESNYKVVDLLFGKTDTQKRFTDLPKLYALDKIRVILYFIVYKGAMLNSEYHVFVDNMSLMESIYYTRNKNHRGGDIPDYQKDKLDGIYNNTTEYYLRFMGTLAFFMSGITRGFPMSSDLVSVVENKKQIKYEKTTYSNIQLSNNIKHIGIDEEQQKLIAKNLQITESKKKNSKK